MRYRVTKKQPNSKMCLVCGLRNELGLHASFFQLESEELLAIFTPIEQHQGYPQRLHGGIATAALDETIGRAIMIKYNQDIWGVTLEFSIRFKQPVPLNDEVRVLGRVTKDSTRYFEGTGEILLANGKVAASAEGKYLKMPIEKIADFDVQEQEWAVVHSSHDPQQVEI